MCEKYKQERPREILVILIAGIGDLIMASSSVRALRNSHPGVKIHLLTSSEASILAVNYPYVDQVWTFPIREIRKDKFQVLRAVNVIRQLRKNQFDLCLNLYRVTSLRGALRMGLLTSLVKPRTRIGHDSMGFGLFLDKKAAKETFQNRHFTDAMMDLAKLAGGVPDDRGMEVFWDKSVEAKWEALFSDEANAPRVRRIGINPGADNPLRRWSPEYHGSVADHLSELRGARIFLFGGPGEEELALRIERIMKHRVTNLAGKLSLNELAYVISRLDLFVTSDTGPMHIAAAVKTPLVALFGPADPVYTRPYTSPDMYRIVQRELSCRPCTNKRCHRPICMESLEPEEVLQACLELLDRA